VIRPSSTLGLLLLSTQVQAECLTSPDLQDHRGYWRYHVIWKTGQHCWYQSAAGRVHVRPQPRAPLNDDMSIPPSPPVEQLEQPSEASPKSTVVLRFDETFGDVTGQTSRQVEVKTVTPHPKNQPQALESMPSNNRLVQLLDGLGIAIFVAMTSMYGHFRKIRRQMARSWFSAFVFTSIRSVLRKAAG
jgi:hypothetical protein